MTDRIALAIRTDELARGLWRVSLLMSEGKVDIDDGAWGAPRVLVDCTGYPEHRAEILTALGDPPAADWEGDEGRRYRDWHGLLLTMPVTLTEQLPPPGAPNVEPEPPAIDPAGVAMLDDDPTGPIVPRPSPVPQCLGAPSGFEGGCGEPGPHGPHEIGVDPPAVTADTDAGLLLEAAIGRLSVEPRPIVVPFEEGVPPLVGLERADSRSWADPTTARSWRNYAEALASHELTGQTFANPMAALQAVDAWPGRHMLTETGAERVAAQLVAAPHVPAVGVATPITNRVRTGRGRLGARWLRETIRPWGAR